MLGLIKHFNDKSISLSKICNERKKYCKHSVHNREEIKRELCIGKYFGIDVLVLQITYRCIYCGKKLITKKY